MSNTERTNWQAELEKPDVVGLLAALRRRDPGLPPWPDALAIFADYDAQRQQDRILRALLAAYQLPDLRSGPVLVALLWRRICARCEGDGERIQSLVVGVLEVCRRFQHQDRSELGMRLVSAGLDRIRSRGPMIQAVPLSDLLPAQQQETADDSDLLSPGEAAKRLGLRTTTTLVRWSETGRITPVRMPSGRYRYRKAEVDALCNGEAQGEPEAGSQTRRTTGGVGGNVDPGAS